MNPSGKPSKDGYLTENIGTAFKLHHPSTRPSLYLDDVHQLYLRAL